MAVSAKALRHGRGAPGRASHAQFTTETVEFRRKARADSCPGQQRRSGAPSLEEEDAARRHFPGDEASGALREALGEEGAGEGRGGPPGPKADPQAHAARGPASVQAAGGASGAPGRTLIVRVIALAKVRPSRGRIVNSVVRPSQRRIVGKAG